MAQAMTDIGIRYLQLDGIAETELCTQMYR